MSLYKLVKCAKFDVPKNSNAQNITEFMAEKGITAGRLIDVETVSRTDDIQTVIVFYIEGNLENLPIPVGRAGVTGADGLQGPRGERGEYPIDATCVYFYKAVGDTPCEILVCSSSTSSASSSSSA